MAYMSEPYRNATKLANHLMDLVFMCKEPSKEAALLMKEWRETEQMKREWRGLPRLSSISLNELAQAKRNRLKNITDTDEPFAELEPAEPVPTAELAPTVTAPPTP